MPTPVLPSALLAMLALFSASPDGDGARPSRALRGGGAGVASDTGSRRTTLDTTLAAATFDSAWRTVGTSLENRGAGRRDWDAVRAELRPVAARATSDSALRTVIQDMLGRLGESHFAVLPGRAAPDDQPAAAAPAAASTLGTAGFTVRFAAGQLVVWRADEGGSAHREGIVAGSVVEQIGDLTIPAPNPPDTMARRSVSLLVDAQRALRGTPGTFVRIVVREPGGARRDVTLARDSVRGPVSRFGNLPPLPAGLRATRRTTADGSCIGIIQFDYWLPPVMPAIDEAVGAMRACAAIVLDLRGNQGGVAGMVMGVAGHFMGEPHSLGTMRTLGGEMRFAVNPRRATAAGASVEPFAGPLGIIVDELSASTSEIFAKGMQSLGRARIFGERSAGQALPAMATRLPNGDVLMHVIADFVAPDGSRIEGRGVTPDERVALTIADARAGRDAPLEAAVAWIERARLPVAP
jgi:carboxyl-terminal processing protease